MFWRSFFVGVCGIVAAAAQTVDTPRFKVTLKLDGALEVVDKRAGVTWTQPGAGVRIGDVRVGNAAMSFRLNETVAAELVVGAETIDLILTPATDGSIQNLEYPLGLRMAAGEPEQSLVLPHCAGLVIPFARRSDPDLARVSGDYAPCADQAGLMMPWIGVTNGQAASMLLLLTPYDARMRVASDAAGYRFGVAWQDSKGRAAYPRRVRFAFANEGGAVALCKSYRAFAREQGWLVTLREKREKLPSLDRFLGAISLWVVDWPQIELFERMRADGIERVLVSYHVTEKVPPGTINRFGHNTVYEPMRRDFVDRLHALGYLAGRYDYYRTIFPPDDAGAGGNLWIFRKVGYPEQLALDEKGGIRAGFQGRGRTPGGSVRGHRCSKCQYEMAQVYIPLDVDRVGYDARLLDAVCAVNFIECFSPAHPVSREEDMQWRVKQLRVALDYGQLAGTEHMAFWAVPSAIYGEAPTTFVRFASYRESFNAQTFTPPDTFARVVLDERLRFPLWQLVFHDAVVITNRWTFTANRYTDASLWAKEDLINLLHGQMPTFMLNRENYAEKAARIVRTAKTVGTWNAEIGYEEMTDFRWLKPDGSVQEAVYASGRGMVVNFDTREFALPDGRRVPAHGFLRRTAQ